MVYPLRLLRNILLIFILLLLGKGLLDSDQPQAYISSPRTQAIINEIQWRTVEIKHAAQDLPGSIEVILRQIFSDGLPTSEAKSV